MKLKLIPNLFLRKISKHTTLKQCSKVPKVNGYFNRLSNKYYFGTYKLLTSNNAYSFCSKNNETQGKTGPLKQQQIPKQNLQVVQTEQKIQNQQVEVFHAKGTLSILDKVPGVKADESGELYVLMFTCGQCNHKQIRSFTKNAYHKGVVLVRCGGCQKVHLVADNLGWFEDQPVNVQTLHKDKVKKVHDHAAISMFLKKAFEQQSELLGNNQSSNQQDSKPEK